MPVHAQVILLVLLSALLHATWNALVKVHADRTLMLGLVSLLAALMSLALLPFAPMPPPAVWRWLLAAVGCHLLFKTFLLAAYGSGDFSHVYPLARGSAPLMVAAVSGDVLRAGQGWGVGLISLGVFILALDRSLLRHKQVRPVLYALLTGVFICGYTVLDGRGVRLMGSSIGYAAWLFLIDGTLFAAGALILRRHAIRATLGPKLMRPLAAGTVSLLGYFIIIWAVRQNAMAPVAALRETGVLFAAVIGAFVLKEAFGPRRILAAALVVAGIAVVSLS
jgi:drug/metabolite transporter (DMT)-like permease